MQRSITTLLVTFASSLVFAEPAIPNIRPYDVQNYAIALTIDPATSPTEFAAKIDIKLRALENTDTIELDVEDLVVDSAKAKGAAILEFKAKDPRTFAVTLARPLRKNRIVTLQLQYRGKIGTDQHGFFKVTDPDEPARGTLLFTHFEPTAARSFFPCNDQPFDKATSELRVSTPAVNQVISNGRKVQESSFKNDSVAWKETTWRLEKPHSPYLVSLAVGPFSKIEKKAGGKEISVWVGSTKVEKAKYALDATVGAVGFFERYLGVSYPWPKYATVGLPTFLWGGMENTSATTMNQERTVLNAPDSEFDKKRIVGLVAHELAHQWFGDFVTMKWWDDVWLNEAFASYMASLATQDQFKNEQENIESLLYLWNEYFRQEDGPRSHPLVDQKLTSIDDNFDAISYTKGEQVLSTLNAFIGEKPFREGLKRYLKKYAYANATYSDFFDAMQGAANQDLTAFRDAWLLQKGYPVLSYQKTWDPKSLKLSLTLSQRANYQDQSEDPVVFPFRLSITAHRLNTPSFDKSISIVMNQGERKTEVALPAEPEWVTLNVGGASLVKILPPKDSEVALANQATGDPDPASRVWALHELGAPLRKGEEISSVAEATLIESLREDKSPYVRNAVLNLFQKSKSRWLPDALAKTTLELARAATEEGYGRMPMSLSDSHGWSEWRSQLLATLGKVKRPESFALLNMVLANANTRIDDLGAAASAMAALGDDRTGKALEDALKLHSPRGYRFRFLVHSAFGSYESPTAAVKIREMARTGSADLIGRLSITIRDNQTLKTSSEWAGALRELLLGDAPMNEELKARLLTTVEEVKTSPTKALLESIVKDSPSERLKGAARKILEKNFSQS